MQLPLPGASDLQLKICRLFSTLPQTTLPRQREGESTVIWGICSAHEPCAIAMFRQEQPRSVCFPWV